MLIVFWPAAKAMLPDAVPEVTATPFTVIVAVASVAVGVTVTEAVPAPTDVVYVVVVPVVPVLVRAETGVSFIAFNVAMADRA